MKPHLIAISTLIFIGQAWAQEETPLKSFDSPDKEWSIQLPPAWRVKPIKQEQAFMAFDIIVTGSHGTGYGRITLFWIQGMQMARAQPYADRPAQLKRYKGEGAAIGLQPMPHLEFRYSQGSRRFKVLMIYRVIQGRGLSMVSTIDEGAMPAIRSGLFEAAGSIQTRLEPWPPVPEGYTATSTPIRSRRLPFSCMIPSSCFPALFPARLLPPGAHGATSRRGGFS
jgi:hypothetical protein